jgi:hypothetical protein
MGRDSGSAAIRRGRRHRFTARGVFARGFPPSRRRSAESTKGSVIGGVARNVGNTRRGLIVVTVAPVVGCSRVIILRRITE